MGWLFIGGAAVSEMAGVFGLSKLARHKKLMNISLYYIGMGMSLFFLYLAFQHLLVSVAYTVFTGIGTSGAVILNMIFFGESKNILRILSLVIIIIGVTGLKAVS